MTREHPEASVVAAERLVEAIREVIVKPGVEASGVAAEFLRVRDVEMFAYARLRERAELTKELRHLARDSKKLDQLCREAADLPYVQAVFKLLVDEIESGMI